MATIQIFTDINAWHQAGDETVGVCRNGCKAKSRSGVGNTVIEKKYLNIGFLFSLETKEFNYGDYKTFLSQVAKIGAVYEPVELENAEGFWYLPNNKFAEYKVLRKRYLDDLVESQESYARIGYKPIPRKYRRYK